MIDHELDAHRRREVEAPVDGAHAVVHQRAVQDRTLDQLHTAGVDQVLDVLAATRREIVQDQDFVPPRRERVHEVGSDESGSSGYEVSHRAVPPKWRWPHHPLEERRA